MQLHSVQGLKAWKDAGLEPRPSAIVEIGRNSKGRIIDLWPFLDADIDTIYPVASAYATEYKYVQVINGVPMQAFRPNELLVIP